MAEAAVITAVGRNKKSIKVGDTVKYVNSDTISRVTEIKKDEQGNVWVLLESTGLWYKEETLEPTELKVKEKIERELTPEELEERFRRQREAMQTFDVGKAGGGGAGG
ncbi:hypothetical protein SAMN02910340_00149 [Methanosarcina thermophila]|jgi:hypothetical protein|uniref:DUF2098 domain-containing protein n=3 Tax=Methanosarcina thermophila TaxID=2210 RepID=A0A1I6X3B7_METTE|nr:DUF2098 domain-containing protein [Methanosarcina thermophila]ALK04715.1 MAG: hypothetical protein AAY43_02135 [Methanosarcina sp. 795]AKB13415.1 hypothetical protein MSTHT_1657 [Methanosarcina thermophila TM-1]AKB15950.1 hypothetical protein MSTHC_1632 [Methanosarcina thermophila CHTI-55]NLU57446.1 DUF2098 family protein [Methanosarcina thermophila]SFT32700.1 hypothetical protein SAMN02910340_00149 [Methanosarcina thermophila]